MLSTPFGEGQPVEHGGVQPRGTGGGQVFLIGRNQCSTVAADGGGNVQQGGVLFGGGGAGQAA
jgi:hypothetical protein